MKRDFGFTQREDRNEGELWEIAAGRGRKATYRPERVKAVLDATG
jgi:hypothetical protein